MDCVIDLTNAFAVSNIEYLHICIFFQFIAQFILAGKTGGDDYTVSRNRCFITPSIGQNDIVSWTAVRRLPVRIFMSVSLIVARYA